MYSDEDHITIKEIKKITLGEFTYSNVLEQHGKEIADKILGKMNPRQNFNIDTTRRNKRNGKSK